MMGDELITDYGSPQANANPARGMELTREMEQAGGWLAGQQLAESDLGSQWTS